MKILDVLSKNNPELLGVFLIIFGIFLIVLAVTNPNWFFGNNLLSYNLKKIQGWIRIIGRNPTRIVVGIMGIFLIVFGVFWIIAIK